MPGLLIATCPVPIFWDGVFRLAYFFFLPFLALALGFFFSAFFLTGFAVFLSAFFTAFWAAFFFSGSSSSQVGRLHRF